MVVPLSYTMVEPNSVHYSHWYINDVLPVCSAHDGCKFIPGYTLGGGVKAMSVGGAMCLKFTDCDDGMELEFQQSTHASDSAGFPFTALGDIMRGFETATNIDD
jgi:hypothetical protein